jgi:hypothetical protein
MKCIVRIPVQPWVQRFFLKMCEHQLDTDGITIVQSSKDLLGKLITGYMRKTAFEAWYMSVPTGTHLRIALPISYNRYGLTRQDLDNISDIMDQFAKKELCFKVAVLASLPGVSRSHSIRECFAIEGITDEEYDQSHFRRYFDRYCKDSLGRSFYDFRKEVTRSLKEIYDPIMVEKNI